MYRVLVQLKTGFESVRRSVISFSFSTQNMYDTILTSARLRIQAQAESAFHNPTLLLLFLLSVFDFIRFEYQWEILLFSLALLLFYLPEQKLLILLLFSVLLVGFVFKTALILFLSFLLWHLHPWSKCQLFHDVSKYLRFLYYFIFYWALCILTTFVIVFGYY